MRSFCAAVREATGVEVEILSGEEEARLAFVGATATMPERPEGVIGVVDVGGGSSEIAVGTMNEGVSWSASLPDRLRQPAPMRTCATTRRPRRTCTACANTLTASSRVSSVPQPDARRRRGRVGDLAAAPGGRRPGRGNGRSEACGCSPAGRLQTWRGQFALDPERVRLLPAGLLVLEAAGDRLGQSLQIGCGGLREGICLELATAGGSGVTDTTELAPAERDGDRPGGGRRCTSTASSPGCEFNARVLELAEDTSVPLLERVKFCAIYASNLDEYFMVRVAGLHDQIDAGVDAPLQDGRTPRETLEEIRRRRPRAARAPGALLPGGPAARAARARRPDHGLRRGRPTTRRRASPSTSGARSSRSSHRSPSGSGGRSPTSRTSRCRSASWSATRSPTRRPSRA